MLALVMCVGDIWGAMSAMTCLAKAGKRRAGTINIQTRGQWHYRPAATKAVEMRLEDNKLQNFPRR